MDLYSSLFNVGDYIKVTTSGEMGWIVGKYNVEGDSNIWLEVKMQLDNRTDKYCSKDVTVITYYNDLETDNNDRVTRSISNR